jgi:hypothetical protein
VSNFINDLLDLFDRTVTIAPYASQTIAGKPSYGTAVSYKARIMMKDVGVRTLEGTMVIGRGKIYLPQVVAATVRDRLTVPVDLPGDANPPILSVSTVDDEFGGSYTVLVIG